MNWIYKLEPITAERGITFEGRAKLLYQKASKHVENKDILDIGCGIGAGTHYLAKQGAKSVLGIDYSQKAINYAKKHFTHRNLTFKKMNALDMKLALNSFNVIISFEVIEHLVPKKHLEFIKKISKLLTIDGLCMVSTPNNLITSPNRKRPYTPYHLKEYRPDELFKLLKKVFPKVEIEGLINPDKEHAKQLKEVKKKINFRIIKYLSQFKFYHFLVPLVPTYIRHFLSGQKNLKPSKYVITNKVKKSATLLITAYK